ncbi:MAG: hypothetical protein M3Y91_18630 [Actinomycetota bacterium]|nr:hypothetical protein [Actinomycetota bacterium]
MTLSVILHGPWRSVEQPATVEVPASLWRKQRLGEPRFISVLMVAAVMERAARLCAVHGLRAYDAVQLGSAVCVREVESSCETVAVFDVTLRRAAAAEGFALLPAG